MNKHIIDEQGKWLIKTNHRMLVEPSQSYLDKANEQVLNPTIVEEQVDEEKVAMAEAIVMLESRVIELENKTTGGII